MIAINFPEAVVVFEMYLKTLIFSEINLAKFRAMKQEDKVNF